RTTPLVWSASSLPSNSRAAFTAMTGGAFAGWFWAGAGGVAINTTAAAIHAAAAIDRGGFIEVLPGAGVGWGTGESPGCGKVRWRARPPARHHEWRDII